MATSIADKLRVKKGFTLLIINKPLGFEQSIGQLSETVSIEKGKKFDQVHWFVRERNKWKPNWIKYCLY
jgi:hypothetical protein